jgi:alcohol dehydrogenase
LAFSCIYLLLKDSRYTGNRVDALSSRKDIFETIALGAYATINATSVVDVTEAIKEITRSGAHVSIDALGHPTTCINSIKSLKKLGKHVQVGLLLADQATPPIPMNLVIAHELEIIGSHSMQAFRYDACWR